MKVIQQPLLFSFLKLVEIDGINVCREGILTLLGRRRRTSSFIDGLITKKCCVIYHMEKGSDYANGGKSYLTYANFQHVWLLVKGSPWE